MAVRLCIVSCFVFAWISVASAETIKVASPGPDFFENVVLDSLLLMDRELQQTLVADIAHLVKTAHFTPQANSWIPKPHPKGRLSTIYNSLNTGNLKDSFISMVAPTVEMACMSRQYDPMNDSSSKCVFKTLKYPIIDTIQINYSYVQGKSFDELVAHLQTATTDADRYQNIVRTLADLMNSGYQKAANTHVAKNLSVIKYPLALVATSNQPISKIVFTKKKAGSYSSDALKEKAKLEQQLSYLEDSSSIKLNTGLREKERMIQAKKAQLQELENDPDGYARKKAAERLADEENARIAAAQNAQRARQEEEARTQTRPVINTATGDTLWGSPASGYTSSQTGTHYAPAGDNGMINTKTGAFVPIM